MIGSTAVSRRGTSSLRPWNPLWLAAPVAVVATDAAALALTGGLPPLRVPLGLLLALFAPGYALLFAALPRSLGRPERLFLSVPVSIQVVVLTFMTLAQAHVGLTPTPLLLVVWAVTVGGTAVGWIRLSRMPLPATSAAPSLPFTTRDTLIAGALACVVLACGAWAGSRGWQAARAQPLGYTELTTQNSTIGVVNHEGKPMQYSVVVSANGTTLQRQDDVTVPVDGSYSLSLPASQDDLDIDLYRPGDTQPYRHVHVGGTGS